MTERKNISVWYAVILLAYCVCYNIVQHGAEKTFFIGLIAAVGAVVGMKYSLDHGFKLYPDEPDYFDTYFGKEETENEDAQIVYKKGDNR